MDNGFGVATRVFVTALFLCLAQGAAADQLTLNNGDRLTGTVTGIKGGKLLMETATLGTVEVPVKNIVGLTTENVVTVEFSAGGYATGKLSSDGAGNIRLVGANQTASRFNLAGVKKIHQGDKIPAAEFKWTGHVNLGASKTSGNTENEAYSLDAEAQGRGEKDRITLSAEYNQESSRGVDTADNAKLAAQYDRFLSKRWFLYVQGSAERDDFEDLRLRTTIGVGGGYQIIDTDLTHLSIEAGPSYVNEDFETATDQNFASGRWALKFDTFIFDKFAQLFHQHEGLVSLERTSDLLIRSKQGIRIPLRKNLNLTAQANVDWDNEPAPGNKQTDTKYILSVGYNW